MTRRYFPVLVLLGMAACGSPETEQPAARKEPPPPPPPPDESRRFPKEGQTSFEIVNDHLLGKDYLPGGNLASYEKSGKSYQQFLMVTKSPDEAALLMFELKGHLSDAKLVAHFGGYFGLDGDTPVFVFPKGNYVAGIVGLPQNEADLAARDFAARLN